uniref:Uncharacterized protein n=1 Tax=Lepeophtheirus salmonis TaxID=72036 RepID=A0A0K2TUG3_LEPSM
MQCRISNIDFLKDLETTIILPYIIKLSFIYLSCSKYLCYEDSFSLSEKS